MSYRSSSNALLLAAAVCGLTLAAAPAQAQFHLDASYSSTEEVTVTAPRPAQARGSFGGRIIDVALTGNVRYDDLDLTTGYGQRTLERRVSRAARDLCRRLDMRYPAATEDSPPCYGTALEDAMGQANAAIARARAAN